LKSFDLLVLGGGVAGAVAAYTAISRAKKERKDFTVAVVSNEGTVYPRAALLSLIANEACSSKNMAIYPINEYEKLGAKFYKFHDILSVNFEDRFVLAKDLQNKRNFGMNFEKLIIATGSLPEILPVEGVGLKGVYTIKWLKDAKELSKKVKPGMRALVVGGGFIGMAAANALLKRGLKVTVLARTRVLSYVLEPLLANYVCKKAEYSGLTIITGSQLEEIGGRERVKYSKINGKKSDFDFVILTTGVKPNTDIFAKDGIDLSDYGAIRANVKTETNIKNVYSVGDCAEKLDLITGKPVHRPLGSLAARTAGIAGLNAFGAEAEFEGSIRHQYDCMFDLHISSMGLSSREAPSLGVSTETLPVKLSAEAHFSWELLRRPFETKMCVVIEKGKDRIVGWQSVGSLKLTSVYDTYIDDMMKKEGTVGDLQEVGLTVP
jgi:NADPH-dependent 2,4-dienoyl-CoA reductase/sulfur reductase-like enzyme